MKKYIISFFLCSFFVFFCGTAKAEITGTVIGDTIFCQGNNTIHLTADYVDGDNVLEYKFDFFYCEDIGGFSNCAFEGADGFSDSNIYTRAINASYFNMSVIVVVHNPETDEYLTKTINITIIQAAAPLNIVSPAPVCKYETVSIVQPPAYGLKFEYPGTPNPDAITVPGDYDILVTDTTECASVGNDTWLIPVTVSFVQGPSITQPEPVFACEVASIEQPAEEGFVYYYFLDDKITPVNPASITNSGTYYICKVDTNTYFYVTIYPPIYSPVCLYSDTIPVSVTIHSRPTFTLATPDSVCAPATVNITQPFEAGFVYKYYQPDKMTALVNPAAVSVSGTYYISKTETATTCTSDTLPVTVTVHPKPAFTPVAPAAVCSPNTVSIEQLYEYGYTFNYYTDAAANNPLFNYTAIASTGTFYITKTSEETGCTSNAMPVTVRINQTPTAVAGDDRAICRGEITRIGATAVPDVSYSWLPVINLSSTTASNPNATVGATITYTLTARLTAAPECFTTDSITITALPLPLQYPLFGGGHYCRNDAYRNTKVGVLNSQTNVTYTLLRNDVAVKEQKVGNDGDSLVWYNLEAGTYKVQAETLLGCHQIMSGTIVVSEVAVPTGSINFNPPMICYGDSTEILIRLVGAPPFSIIYKNPYDESFTVNNISSYFYTTKILPVSGGRWEILEIEDANHCRNIYSMESRPFADLSVGDIRSSAGITSSRLNNTICRGEKITLTINAIDANNKPLTYLWSTGSTLPSITVSPGQTTTYTVEVSDVLGCIIRDSIVITVNSLPNVYFYGIPPLMKEMCQNQGPTQLIGVPGGGSFSGPNVINNSIYDPSKMTGGGADFVTYTYVDTNGCGGESTMYFYVNPVPTVNWYVPEELGPPTKYEPEYFFCRFHNDSLPLQGIPRSNSNTIWRLNNSTGFSNAKLIRTTGGGAYIEDALPGIYDVTYVYKDNKGCMDSLTKRIHISEDFRDTLDMGALTIFGGQGDTLCRRDTRILVKSEMTDVTFRTNDPILIIEFDSITGECWIDPSRVNPGKYRIMAFQTDGKACGGYNHYSYKDFWIQSPITILPLDIPKSYCIDHEPVPFHFSSARPVTGFVTIVKDNNDTILHRIPNDVPATADLIFNPAWGAGTYRIIYTYNDRYCDNTFTDIIRVHPLPVIDMNLYKRDYCYGDVVTFNSKPNGGIYSAGADSLALNANIFKTIVSGTGAFTITYEYIDNNTCFSSDSIEIYVHGQEDGDMQIMGLDSIYCENTGTVEIFGFPFEGDSVVPYFRNTAYLTDLGGGRAMIDLSKTGFNSTNTVIYFVKEYYTDVYNNLDSCIHSVSKTFRVISQSVDFYGYNNGDTICGFTHSLSLIGSKTQNSWFTINSVTGAEVTTLANGRGTLYPDQLPEGWHTVTYHYNHIINGIQICEVIKEKTFYLLPVAPITPRLVCSPDNHNSFEIENSVVGLEYELWTNGVLFSRLPGNGATISFPSIPVEAICAFYINRNQCRIEHTARFHITPLTVSINKESNASCFSADNGKLTAVVKGGNAPTSVLWSTALSGFSSTDMTVGSLMPDVYTVVATDSIGCTSTASESITQPNPLELTVNEKSGLLCYGSRNGFVRVTATGGTTPYTYRWLDASNNVVSSAGLLSNIPAGSYRLLVTDRNNCSADTIINIYESTPIVFQVINKVDVAIYGQATGEIEIDVTGGEAPYNYEWTALGIDPVNKNNQNQTDLIAGTYFVKITDDNTCRLDTSVVITQPEVLTVSAVVQDETCYKSGDGSIILTVSKGQIPYTFAWSKDGNPVDTTKSIYNQGKGIYSVVVTDGAGDTYTQNYEIKSPDSLFIFVTGRTDTAILCYNGKNAVLEVEAYGGTAAYSYEWSGSGIDAANIHNTYLSGMPVGIYRIKVTDAHNCIVIKDIEITQPVELEITLTSFPPSCHNSTDAWIDAAVTGGVAPYTYFWEGNGVLAYSQNQSNIASGNYRLTVTDANGCTKSAEITLDNPIELKIAISATPHVCEGTDAEISFAMNENRNWHIDYSDGSAVFSINSTTATAITTHAITHTTTLSIMQAYDQDGCLATITANDALVTLHAYPDVALLTNRIEICKGEEAKIPFTLSGESPWNVVFRESNYLYEKTNLVLGMDTLTVSPTGNKSYELISVSTDYCTTQKSEIVDVIVHPLSTLAASCANPVICNSETTDIQLLLTGEAPWKVYYKEGETEKILTVNTPSYTLTVSPTTTTRYYFYKIESGFACVNYVFSEIIITVNDLPAQAAAITGMSEVCAGSQTSYFVPFVSSATYYEWVLPAGVTISAGAGTNVIMADFSLNAQTGLIQVRAVNLCGKGEYTTKPVNVTGRVSAASQIIAPDTVCPLQRSISISTPAIDNATEYIWRVPPGFIIESGQGAATIQVSLLAGAVTGDIEVYGRNSCNSGAAVQKKIVINEMPVVEAGADLYTNCKDYITLNATPLNASYFGTWRLLQGNGEIADVHNPRTQVTGLALGTNLFIWEVSNRRCVKQDTAIVFNNSADKAIPEITENYIFCENELVLRANTPTVGTGHWDRVVGGGNIQTPNSPVTLVSEIPGGMVSVFRWTTVNGSCSNFETVYVYSNMPGEVAYAGQDDTTYINIGQLNARVPPSAYEAEWTAVGNNAAIIENPKNHRTTVYNLLPGSNTFRWTVRYKDCEAHDEVIIYLAKTTVADFQLDTTSGCAPLTVKIENIKTGVVKYYWDFGDGTYLDDFDDPWQHTYTQPGRYVIKLTAVGEEANDVMTDTIVVLSTPKASFKVIKDEIHSPNTKLLVRDESTPLGSITKWFWNFGDGNTSTAQTPEYRYEYSGTYDISLHVESYTGCVDDTIIYEAVRVTQCCFATFPNAFIPNKAYANGGEYSLAERNHDVFYPVWSDVIEYQLEIFNRWGEKIFISKDVNIGWDGYVGGKLSPSGIYVYRVSGKYINGSSFDKKGEVTLIQ